MTPNLIKLAFVLSACFAGFGGLLINIFERYLPTSFSKLYRHGKLSSSVKHVYLDKCEVPKRWFKHFYCFAVPLCIGVLILFYNRYILNNKVPNFIMHILYFSLGRPIQSLIPEENAFLAMIIFTIHCFKRFYESHYISVYSDVYMNFTIYLIGLFHYFGTIISILGESRDIVKDSKINLDWTRLSLLDYTCSIVLLLSTYMQYRTNIILSNLRKDKNGNIVTKKYKIPRGELFEYISGPLHLTEIIIYLCLSVILRNASTFHFVTFWVILNQVECAYLSHQWSLSKFDNYPKSRKVIIPFIF